MENFRTNGVFLLLTALLFLSGCGDSNMFESMAETNNQQAQIESAVDALNAGDYQTAINELSPAGTDFNAIVAATDPGGNSGISSDPALTSYVQNNPEGAEYLASAYMAQSGFDTLELIKQAANAQETNNANDITFATAKSVFGIDGTTGKIANLGNRLNYVNTSVNLLSSLVAVSSADAGKAVIGSQTKTDRQVRQALYAAVDLVLLLSDCYDGSLLLPYNNAYFNLANFTARKARIENRLQVILDAKNAILLTYPPSDPSKQNDIELELQKFLTNIGYVPGNPPGSKISDTAFRNYLTLHL